MKLTLTQSYLDFECGGRPPASGQPPRLLSSGGIVQFHPQWSQRAEVDDSDLSCAGNIQQNPGLKHNPD